MLSPLEQAVQGLSPSNQAVPQAEEPRVEPAVRVVASIEQAADEPFVDSQLAA